MTSQIEFKLNTNLEISDGVYILADKYGIAKSDKDPATAVRHAVMAFVDDRKDYILCYYNNNKGLMPVLGTHSVSTEKGINCKRCISIIKKKLLRKTL